MANTDIVTREDIGNGLAINANKLEADFTKVASKNDLLTKADLVNGKVPASQLPSFIDEIQEYPSIATFPITGQSDILYLALDTNKLYRWSGTAYVDLSALAGMPDFALNANVVHKTLDETIDGIKSFNSPIYAQDGVSLKNNNAPLLQTGRTILYANASQFGFLNGNDKGAIFMYNNANSLVYVLPSETGTLALLSDLAPYLTIVGAESTYQTLVNLSVDLAASATKYPSVNAVNAGLATKFNNPTGTVSQYLRGDGSVANFPFIPTLIWGNIAGNLSDQTDLQSALDSKFNNPTGTTSDYIRGDGSIFAFPTPYGLLPTGGEAGQILSKIDGTDYNATWIDNYALWTSVLRHEVKAGEALNKGQAVYISPIQDGTNMIVTKADYSQESTSSKTLGLIMQTLATNGFGQVVTEGLFGGLNTIGANQGDPVWLGAGGNLIYGLVNKPEAPNHLVFIGIVTRVNANNGEIFVKVQNGFELEELHNVKIVNKANNEVLAYEQSSGLWKNKAINDLIGYVPANNNDVLHLGGNETVSGNKTFTGATAIAGLFIDETFGYANIATHTQLKAHADYFHFNASSNNKGAKFIYGTIGQRIYSLPTADGVLALTSDIPTLGGLGGVPLTRTISINGTTYDLSENRTWNLSATEVATALGYTPLSVESDPIFTASPAGGITALQIGNWNTAYGWGNHASAGYLTAITSAQVTGALGYTPVPTTRTITINGTPYDLSADRAWTIASGVTSFNTRTGAITLISADVTGALGFTPYNASNPSGYISGITSGMVTTALGYTPYNSSNPAGYISGISSGMVTTALGYTPYNSSNPSGYISGISSLMVTNALGYTPYNSSNPAGYVTASGSVNYASSAGNADTVDGEHASNFATHRGEGRNYVEYSRYVYNNGAYSGSGWIEPSDLGVRYANSAGSANSVAWGNVSGKPSSIFIYPGWDNWNANTIPENYSSFSYSNGCPWTGPISHFSAGGYGLQLNASYGGNGTQISYRTRNGDAGSWNSWWRLYSDTYRPYADSAGNADTVDGYHMNQAVTVNSSPTFQEVYANGWFRNTGSQGMYNPQNGAHFYSNNDSYGSWRIDGSRNSWSGIHFGDSGNTLMMNSNESGHHRSGYGWQFRWYNGTLYCSKNSYGGGSEGVVLDSINVGSYAVTSLPSNMTKWDTWYSNAYLGSNGDLYMGWAGAWTSSWFNQNVKTNAGPTFQTVYLNDWCRVRYETGVYFESYDAGLRSAYQASFGQVASYGTARSGHGGFVTVNNYITNLMQDTSGNFGFFSNSDWAWRLFYNRGNNCWGIGTDNTYSGDGFRCVKYGSAEYGWTTWSDRRAKENITEINGALNKILGMRGVYYNYIKDEVKSQHVGFIAQELIEVLPQSVRYAEEIDEYNINYGPIVSVLAEGIKEQHKIILDQGSQIAELKLLVNQLINR